MNSRAVLLATLTEKQWQVQVLEWAERAGWRAYHTYDSRRSAAGFPDLVLVKPKEPVLFIELKTVNGELTRQQKLWLSELEAASGWHHTMVWRPDMETEVKALLGLRT